MADAQANDESSGDAKTKKESEPPESNKNLESFITEQYVLQSVRFPPVFSLFDNRPPRAISTL